MQNPIVWRQLEVSHAHHVGGHGGLGSGGRGREVLQLVEEMTNPFVGQVSSHSRDLLRWAFDLFDIEKALRSGSNVYIVIVTLISISMRSHLGLPLEKSARTNLVCRENQTQQAVTKATVTLSSRGRESHSAKDENPTQSNLHNSKNRRGRR